MHLLRIFQLFLIFAEILSAKEKVIYVNMERATVTYFNPKYGGITLVSRRYSRDDPVYYISMNITSYFGFGNNYTVHFFFYEFMSNTYKRSFVELHLGLCDAIYKNKWFGYLLQQGKFAETCPYPPGEYRLYNISIPNEVIPKNFPFNKGRIYYNVTFGSLQTDELVYSAQIDIELKHFTKKNN